MHMAEPLQRELRDGVLRLTMDRPDQMNALDTALVTALGDAVREANADSEVRVVHLTGSGRAFCAGADLAEAGELTEDGARFGAWLELWRATFDAIESSPKPVVALLNGLTLAGGLELALTCDFMIASSAAKVGDVHANYGLVPGGGGTQRLPDAIGTRHARWLMYTAAVLTADEALRIGLVQQVLPAERFDDDAWQLGLATARRSAPGIAFMKRMSANRGVDPRALDEEAAGAVRVVTGPDGREGLAAFKAKRTPVFTERA
jgi:enoyl-CoA hydratase/carnithine racemase